MSYVFGVLNCGYCNDRMYDPVNKQHGKYYHDECYNKWMDQNRCAIKSCVRIKRRDSVYCNKCHDSFKRLQKSKMTPI